MRPMASGHGTSSSPLPLLPTCVVHLTQSINYMNNLFCSYKYAAKKYKKKKREREGKQEREISKHQISGVLPIPSIIQLPIQVGVSAPTAAVGGGVGSLCGPLIA